jgi:hypothetical protein
MTLTLVWETLTLYPAVRVAMVLGWDGVVSAAMAAVP